METIIYFVRHAKVEYIKDNFVKALTMEGNNDAKKLVDYFKDKTINHMFSSPYIRTKKTISYLKTMARIKNASRGLRSIKFCCLGR